jgi:hypothetical protein
MDSIWYELAFHSERFTFRNPTASGKAAEIHKTLKGPVMRKLFLIGLALVAMLVPAASASAAPTGEWAKFAKCPTSNPSAEFCLYAETNSGTITIGKKPVPVVKQVVLQGGLDTEGEFFSPATMIAATDGNTLTKAAQPVPGGLLGVVAPTWWPDFIEKWFNDQINAGFTGVTATMELAKPATSVKFNALNAITGAGPTIEMPVKVKLDNPILGSNCYIGSSSNPITLKLTTGETAPPPPNTPITGFPGIPGANPTEDQISLTGNKIVDNSFAAPGVNGCGGIFSFLIDPLVGSVVGVPSPAGTNTAILEGNTYIGYAPSVKASDP